MTVSEATEKLFDTKPLEGSTITASVIVFKTATESEVEYAVDIEIREEGGTRQGWTRVYVTKEGDNFVLSAPQNADPFVRLFAKGLAMENAEIHGITII